MTNKTKSKNKVKANDHPSYGIYTLIAILIPPAGIIMGAIMLTKDEEVDKKLGEHAIVCSILGFILGAIAWYVLLGTSTTTYVVPTSY